MITNEDAEKVRKRLNSQDKLIFDFTIGTGLRISDVLRLKRREIDKIMYVKEAKTRKHKIIELSDDLYKRLKPLKDNSENFAFFSAVDARKHLHRSTYHRHLKKALEGLKIDCSAHSTRKLYASNIFNRTKNIFDVQKALNHKYITTTAAYLDIDIVALMNGMARGGEENKNT
jgi:integrase